MTNGTVVVLGRTGRNFGAGMTGGTAYVLDLDDTFESLYNPQLIRVERLGTEEDVNFLRGLIYKHLELSESRRAKEILADWPDLPAEILEGVSSAAAPRPSPPQWQRLRPRRSRPPRRKSWRRRNRDRPRGPDGSSTLRVPVSLSGEP